MNKFKLTSHHWIANEEDDIIIGDGRLEILEKVKETGSLNKAASAMSMSYKAIWGKIKATEKHLGKKIIRPNHKEGSSLTEDGICLMDKFKEFKRRCLMAEQLLFNYIFNKEEMPIICITGWSGSGKTSLIAKLISKINERNLCVGVIKHTSHNQSPDRPGKDTWVLKQADAEVSIYASKENIGIFMTPKVEPSPQELMLFMPHVDIILAEGYKQYKDIRKIMLIKGSPQLSGPIPFDDPSLIAVVSETIIDALPVPWFFVDDIDGLTDFIIRSAGINLPDNSLL